MIRFKRTHITSAFDSSNIELSHRVIPLGTNIFSASLPIYKHMQIATAIPFCSHGIITPMGLWCLSYCVHSRMGQCFLSSMPYKTSTIPYHKICSPHIHILGCMQKCVRSCCWILFALCVVCVFPWFSLLYAYRMCMCMFHGSIASPFKPFRPKRCQPMWTILWVSLLSVDETKVTSVCECVCMDPVCVSICIHCDHLTSDTAHTHIKERRKKNNENMKYSEK